ncbi:alpha/beta hydrolase [Fervidibacillus halotolerans]|uniref:Lysophospholipase n=1 Tax=Fervidibacillus halotolerans TaxID=2980027 RepID=A0A9E8M1C1_9BACI|nr:alpha/beta hydrolase [Fervidibacillus halotolerans]WAA13429.1 lysophospholipase [Fervidibacillus halotolerans]
MEEKTRWLKVDDGVEIFIKSWESTQKPKAIIQIAHGMAEHIERYHEFAKFFVTKGFLVVGNDHRGHGKTGEKEGRLGYLADEEGFERAVDDLRAVNLMIKEEFPKARIFLMGHSMGSFFVRRYIQKYANSIHGAIISGTGGNPRIGGKIGKWIAKREIKKRGRMAESPTIQRLIFGSYNKKFKDDSSPFAWLTRDTEIVKTYMNDPFCGFTCTSGFFYDLFTGLETIHQDENIRKIPNDFPMFIFSGEQDPVGGNTKGVKKVIRQYEKNGLTNIQSMFFPKGRHEMLNELNKEDVYEHIFHWIENQIK